jgi:MOSC domain-containing protein YiiM
VSQVAAHEEPSSPSVGQGTVVAICIAAEAAQPLQIVAEVEARAGAGLVGDRYFAGVGTYTNWVDPVPPSREVTLIEGEALAALAAEYGVALELADSRRNIVTRGVRLNDLVDAEFTVGEVRLRGMRLCEPCTHLAGLVGAPDVVKGLTHRGGLRARILTDGMIRPGDPIAPA